MSGTTDQITRRSVIRTTGALGVLGLAGTASAVTTQGLTTGQCVVADGSDGTATVFKECGHDLAIGSVKNGRSGTVKKVCKGPTEAWGYVAWDTSSGESVPDGWVPESQLAACVQSY